MTETLRERIENATVPGVEELTMEERIARLERAVVTLCEIVDGFATDFDNVTERASTVLRQVEEQGPSAFLSSLMTRRRRR